MVADLQYPIGKFTPPKSYDPDVVDQKVEDIAQLPHIIEKLIQDLPQGWLETPYREGGWTGRQLIHHLADSHTNAFIRCKMATTEDWPNILPYRQDDWATQIDHTLDIDCSLSILKGLHQRWATLLNALSPDDWTSRGYFHPEYGRRQPLFEIVALYSWHGRHHTGHLNLLHQN